MDEKINFEKKYNNCDILEADIKAVVNNGDNGYIEFTLKPNLEMNVIINDDELGDASGIEKVTIRLNGSIEAEQFLEYMSDFYKNLFKK